MRSRKMDRRNITVLVLVLISAILAGCLLLQTDYIKYQLEEFGFIDRYHAMNETTISS